jgi:DNA modification methylase
MTAVREQEYAVVPVDEVRMHPDNAKRGDVTAIAGPIGRNGFYGALVVQRSTGYILVGNHRWLAAREEGLDELPVIWVDCDADEARRIMVADNRTSELGGFDEEALAALLRSFDGDLEGTGYTLDDLAALLNGDVGPAGEQLTDVDDVPDPPPPISVPGDIWLLGPHRVLCGSATVPTDYERLLDGDLADRVFTDPPYNVAYVGGTKDALTIENDSMPDAEFDGFLFDAFVGMASAMRAGAAIYVCHADGSGGAFRNAYTRSGLMLKQILIWVKDRFVLGRQDYNWQHEPIIYGWKPGAGHAWYGGFATSTVLDDEPDYAELSKAQLVEIIEQARRVSTVVREARPSRNPDHPTMKPVGLITRLVLNSTKPGDVVLDPFGGSGSTLIACHATSRVARLIELDPRYVDVICRRFQEHTGVMPVNAATGREHDFTKEQTDGQARTGADADEPAPAPRGDQAEPGEPARTEAARKRRRSQPA